MRIEESVLLQVVLYRPTHLCVAHLNCTKKSFFFGVVRCLEGGYGPCSGGRGLHGFFFLEEGGVIWVQGSHSLGEKAVEQSGGAGSDAPVPSS